MSGESEIIIKNHLRNKHDINLTSDQNNIQREQEVKTTIEPEPDESFIKKLLAKYAGDNLKDGLFEVGANTVVMAAVLYILINKNYLRSLPGDLTTGVGTYTSVGLIVISLIIAISLYAFRKMVLNL